MNSKSIPIDFEEITSVKESLGGWHERCFSVFEMKNQPALMSPMPSSRSVRRDSRGVDSFHGPDLSVRASGNHINPFSSRARTLIQPCRSSRSLF
jgi:hypothetical protein